MNFNTVYPDMTCPHCQGKITSGVGFRFGALENRKYAVGDEINWTEAQLKSKEAMLTGRIETIGYFNCDNPQCSSWQDCYPNVQTALIVINNNRIEKAEIYQGKLSGEKFEILKREP